MSNFGPGFGRERRAEDLADEIINQPGEGLDDLLEVSEIEDGAHFDDDLNAFEDSYEESDDGGDYSDF